MLRNSQATQAEEHKGVNSTIARLKEDNECTKRNYEEQVGVPRWSCSPGGLPAEAAVLDVFSA